MGRTKSYSCRGDKGHQAVSTARHKTPPDSDTDMFGSPEIWCKKKTKAHGRETKGHRSRKEAEASEEPRKKKKHRNFYSHLNRLIEMASRDHYRDITTPIREPRTQYGYGYGYGGGCSTPPRPPPPPAPLNRSSPYTPKRYLCNELGMGITPPPSYSSRREHHCRMPVSPTPMEASSGCSLSSTLNPNCESCIQTHHLNSILRQSLLAHTREIYNLLQSWSEKGKPSVEPMEWQPESAALVIEKERRPSEMCKALMSMGSVEDWVGVMKGLEEKEKEGGLVGVQAMEVERATKRVREDIIDGEKEHSGLGVGGDGYCLPLRQRRMAVAEGGGQG